MRRLVYRSQEYQAFMASVNEDLELLSKQVNEIGEQVKSQGDEALVGLAARFDGARLGVKDLRITESEMDEAYQKVDAEYLDALRVAIDNIRLFHQRQLKTGWVEPDINGNLLGQMQRPLERVGIYVPGGTAAYPSSVLMNAIPAQVAGVKEIVMVTPPAADGRINPYTLVAAGELGLKEIYKTGGAQAVFALAFGTDTIAPVDKITGPGNIYVTLAKKMVYGQVDIDMLAGPSEILIIADETANPAWVAADMMSQAEHDRRARSVLVTADKELLNQVEKELYDQVQSLSRRDIIEEALDTRGAFVLVDSMSEAFKVANEVAPEHLELMIKEPFSWLGSVENAGAVFIGSYTPEPVGDYIAGPNHILPTGGTARFYSPVTVDTFMKKSSLIYYSQTGFQQHCDQIIKLAEVEGLTAHANSARIRKGL
ncbi:MAG: histidinol dehydrogenase [Chitinophagales bacterium]